MLKFHFKKLSLGLIHGLIQTRVSTNQSTRYIYMLFYNNISIMHTSTGLYLLICSFGVFIYNLHKLYMYWGRNVSFDCAIHKALNFAVRQFIIVMWLPICLLVKKNFLKYKKITLKNKIKAYTFIGVIPYSIT